MAENTESKGPGANWPLIIFGGLAALALPAFAVIAAVSQSQPPTIIAAIIVTSVVFGATLIANYRSPFRTELRDWLEWALAALPVLIISLLVAWPLETPDDDWVVLAALVGLLTSQTVATLRRKREARKALAATASAAAGETAAERHIITDSNSPLTCKEAAVSFFVLALAFVKRR